MIKAVIFDCYGVLVANEADIAFEMLGGDLVKDHPKILELYRQYDLGFLSFEDQHHQLAEMVGVSYETWVEALEKNKSHNLPLIEYARTLPVKRSILSNIGRYSFDKLFETVDFSFFDDIVLSADVGMVKPDERIFKLAANRLEVEPEECVFIDDMIANVEAAKRAGMRAIHYQSFHELHKELKVLLGV